MQADALPSEPGRAHIKSQSPASKELRNCPQVAVDVDMETPGEWSGEWQGQDQTFT